ncbi:hypothetical protein T484DRAFT_1832269 [Baffinella frigidus]|nr:hypothetical protein T484DRAFT_1832269 [Cryptophyta sp. CCMP2293]
MSTLGSLMDLFLYCLLMCRHDMCKMIWSRLDVPVRSSLLAATWYRRWSNRPGVKASHIREAMIQHAVEFEEMSVQVQLLMMRHDSGMALKCIERPSRLWKGQTAVDLAILGGCRRFVEVCCAEALDSRWAGDLNPYRQPLGLYWTVASGVFSFGLLAPTMVAYREPPFAEVWRGPTQKRKRLEEPPCAEVWRGPTQTRKEPPFAEVWRGPTQKRKRLGWDMRFSTNSIEDRQQDESRSSARTIDGVIAADLMSSSHLEFNFPWWERYRLFFAAPVTIFVLDATFQTIQAPFTIFVLDATFQTIQNVVFMVVLFSDGRAEKGFSFYEQVLMCFMVSTTVTELVQILVESPTAYFATMWNWLTANLPFLALLFQNFQNGSNASNGSNLSSGTNSGTFAEFPAAASPGGEQAYTFLAAELAGDSWGFSFEDIAREGNYYAASLFCMWFRVLHLLSVHQDLGPLVISGTGLTRGPACQNDENGSALLAENQSLECWSSWWLWRTYYQSFGQPFLDQLSSDSANAISIIMWPTMNLMLVNLLIALMNDTIGQTMNLMLVNLLIALMNDTYVAVKDQSRLEWMIEMFQIAKEYRSPSRLNVIMLLKDVIIFIMNHKDISARMRQLQETPGEAERLREVTAELSQVSRLEGVDGSARSLLPPPAHRAAPAQAEWVSEEQKAKQAREIGHGVRHMLRSQTIKSFRKKSNSKFEAHFRRGWGLVHPVELIKLILTSLAHLPARLIPFWQPLVLPLTPEEQLALLAFWQPLVLPLTPAEQLAVHEALYQKVKRKRQKVDKQRKYQKVKRKRQKVDKQRKTVKRKRQKVDKQRKVS